MTREDTDTAIAVLKAEMEHLKEERQSIITYMDDFSKELRRQREFHQDVLSKQSEALDEMRATHVILQAQSSNLCDRLDAQHSTIYGNGTLGLKTKVAVIWYAVIVLIFGFLGVLTPLIGEKFLEDQHKAPPPEAASSVK